MAFSFLSNRIVPSRSAVIHAKSPLPCRRRKMSEEPCRLARLVSAAPSFPWQLTRLLSAEATPFRCRPPWLARPQPHPIALISGSSVPSVLFRSWPPRMTKNYGFLFSASVEPAMP